MNHRLWGMRCYLMGAMDRVKDYGIGWRKYISSYLQNLGVVILDPTDKPIDIGTENKEDRNRRHTLKEQGDFDTLAREMREIRSVDLRMVDMSDFGILNVDTDVHMCGSYEESSWANRLKNPLLIHCVQGKRYIPDWLLGVVPHEHIFSSWEGLYKYLWHVHTAEVVETYKRWMFFDYSKMVPSVTKEESTGSFTGNMMQWANRNGISCL